MYYIAAAILLVILIILCYNTVKIDSFCLYDKPVYYPTYRGLKARDYNVRCTAYCSSQDSPCVVWCD